MKNCGYLYSESMHLTQLFSTLVSIKYSHFIVQLDLVIASHGYPTLNLVSYYLFTVIPQMMLLCMNISYYEQCGCFTNDTTLKNYNASKELSNI